MEWGFFLMTILVGYLTSWCINLSDDVRWLVDHAEVKDREIKELRLQLKQMEAYYGGQKAKDTP